MKKYLLNSIVLLIFGLTQSQTRIDQNLKNELNIILKSDQILREYIDSETTENRKVEILKETGYSKEELFQDNVFMILKKRDSINLVKVEKIIAEYGYPGKSLVGEPTNEATWYVIQHSNEIPKYFPLIKEAANKSEIPFTLFAMMQDRLLTSEGKEQIYGTQGGWKKTTNKETGLAEYLRYISPIKDPESVNERRKKAGFTSTVEENAKRMEIVYKVYSLDEINNIK
ncbi:DUF6624 domain-containing protein [Flavobacterium gawalongense]|uniref:Uncharacterized protein n=1 Tax=Flavobacterium gawalongense TaxID=2594432 RepID=A0A553BZ57_9FLAO|nr:DUF6624 domain-containing protein [Flavobacterium gawalongense]TRX04637.1 hypothetical protein FNW33_01070 [Flavobacterium gawalongense]TRX10524.1 hypothetical protein FNW12_01055 [Flavobacterium gawalongense]TRX13567.1 hypothetical protein FNW11_01565 [Flavobacterium gawalongense]TRX15501.1 hypothetical protein FNW10_00125 [Flavobacterium gawalongense]TRX31340.1 hypothetical protein FNW38_00125 [Flavobacterium gawalongense]